MEPESDRCPPVGPSSCTPQPITLYDGGGGASRVQGYRYPHQSLEIVTHGGKRTAQVFCRPRARTAIQNNNLVNNSQQVNMNDYSSYMTDGTDRTDTFSVVSNLSELSELSTLHGIDEDLMTLKRRSDMVLPELHGPKKDPIHRKQSRVKKRIGAFEMLTHQRDIAIKEKNELAVEISKRSSQSQIITNLKQNEIFLLREKSNLESELKGLHQNMKRILEANILLRNEISNLNSEKNLHMSQMNSTEENELKVSQLKKVIGILKDENLVYAKQIDAKNDELKEINIIVRNSKIDSSKAIEFETETKKIDDQTQLITSLKQSVAACKLDLEATKSSKVSSEQDTKIARQELESVTQARDWYQKQMKESQQMRANAMKDAMVLSEETLSLKSSNEQMSLKIKTLENEIEMQKTTMLKEKENLVAKLESLDEDIEDENVEVEQKCQNNKSIENMRKVKETLCQAENILTSEKATNEKIMKHNQELEEANIHLKVELLKNETEQQILRRGLKEASDEKTEITDKYNICKEDYEKKVNYCQKLETQMEYVHKEKFDQDEKIRSMKLDLGKSIANNNKLKKEMSEDKNTIQIIKVKQVELETQSKDFASLREEINKVKEENLTLENKVVNTEQLTIELVQKNETLRKFEEDLSATLAEKNNLAVEKESTENKFRYSENEKKILQEEKVELLSLNTKLSECVHNLENQNANLLTDNSDLEKNLDVLNLNLDKKSRQIEIINSKKKEYQMENEKLLNQFNDEKEDLENVIKELEKVQESMLKDKSKGVSFERELFEKLQNADRENKEKIKILDSNLKNAENRIKEQSNIKDAYLRELEEVQEAKLEQGNVIELLEEKIKRIEREVKNLSSENEMKDENLNTLKIDLLELERDRGTLSAVLFENKSLQENCALLEKNLLTLNECQGKVSVLEHNLFKCRETVHAKEEHIEIVTKEKVKLKEEIEILKLELSDKKKELLNSNQEADAKSNLIENLKKDIDSEISKNNEINICVENLDARNLELETKLFKSNQTVTELKNRLALSDQKETIFEDQLTSMNMSLDEKNEEMRIKNHEIEQKQNLHKIEIEHFNIQLTRLEKNFNERESAIHSLRGEKQTHQKQLKQMQLALKTSLHHIRGLRTIIEDSHNLPAPKFDEQTLSNLLHLNTATERPKLSALKLCLADLRQDVRELNMQLSDRSRGSTPTTYHERQVDGTETPSFLDRFQGSTISPSHSSGTPSLNISSSSSLNPSPEHRVNKLR